MRFPILVPATLAIALLGLPGCASTRPLQNPTDAARLSSATLESIDDAQIITVARRMSHDQHVLGGLADNHAGSSGVHDLARKLLDDSAASPPVFTGHASTLADELAERDVGVALNLARYGGSSFDRAFLDAERSILDADIHLVHHTLMPAVTDPHLRAELERVAATFSGELEALDALDAIDAAHRAP